MLGGATDAVPGLFGAPGPLGDLGKNVIQPGSRHLLK
jgi:hypothetical protein